SAGPVPGLQDGPVDETSMFHSPSPVMFIWYFAPIVFASSAFFSRAAGSSSLNSFFTSAAMGIPLGGGKSESRFSGVPSALSGVKARSGAALAPPRRRAAAPPRCRAAAALRRVSQASLVAARDPFLHRRQLAVDLAFALPGRP